MKIVIALFFDFLGSLGGPQASVSPIHVKFTQDLAAFCGVLFLEVDSKLLEADVQRVFNIDFLSVLLVSRA